MGIESWIWGLGWLLMLLFLQKESPSMGIESRPNSNLQGHQRNMACKKSPQAWGLKGMANTTKSA